MTHYPSAINRLIQLLKKLPGVGTRTAERFAFHLLDWKGSDLEALSTSLHSLKQEVKQCNICNCFEEEGVCPFCTSAACDPTKLCIIASPKDVYLIDETGVFKGLYHVLGGLLSPIQGRMATHLNLENLWKRIEEPSLIKEVILALDSTLEGDTTSLFLKEQLQKRGVTVSRLAFGIPMGSPLDFIDGGTLARALAGRQHLS